MYAWSGSSFIDWARCLLLRRGKLLSVRWYSHFVLLESSNRSYCVMRNKELADARLTRKHITSIFCVISSSNLFRVLAAVNSLPYLVFRRGFFMCYKLTRHATICSAAYLRVNLKFNFFNKPLHLSSCYKNLGKAQKGIKYWCSHPKTKRRLVLSNSREMRWHLV